MTIFLHGSDGYRRSQRLRILIGQFLKKYPGVGIRRLDAELDEDAAGKAADLLGSASLFSPRTLVVLADALQIDAKELKPLIERTAASQNSHLILVADTDKPAKAYARLLESDVIAETFPVLTGGDWAQFIAREAKARNLPVTRQQLQQLAYAFPGDSWGVATELDVLAVMPEAMRDARIAQASRSVSAGTPGWNELRRIGTGSPAARLAALVRLEASGEAAAKLFAMAAYTAHPVAAATGDLAVKMGAWDHEEALIGLAVH